MDMYVLSIVVNPLGYLFAGTESGVFRSAETTTAVKEVMPDQPLSFLLEQNYPNPFNPTTMIRFSLPRAGYITLKVYNMLGKEIASLIDKKLPAGNHQAKWDAGGLPSGLYFYRLQTDGFAQTRKLILAK
jgi:hypothetical protein